ncbi:hypothetical protein CDAR_588721 [Caerostris darwini]|uniref:Uncharacterized protein n=1 Tax=Caerostris darwini TaxID=1538125 RepID=A0AAV4UUQ6_9ARAC|nr:hypothetical protein CDAR_588721 [Caerostris darwini]
MKCSLSWAAFFECILLPMQPIIFNAEFSCLQLPRIISPYGERVSLKPGDQYLLLKGGMASSASFRKLCKHTAAATVILYVLKLAIIGLRNMPNFAAIMPKEISTHCQSS